MKNRIAIIGGGIAGMSAALRLANANATLSAQNRFEISLFEKRKFLGGRAASFFDKATNSFVDHCQHVGMNCCVFFKDFCKKTEILQDFETLESLNFSLPNGKRVNFAATSFLPAPFHLAISFLALSNFTIRQRASIARTVLRLAKTNVRTDQTAYQWLLDQGQEESVIHDFWETFLVSALGERIERVSLRAAKKIFVDGFLRNRTGYHVLVPRKPLRELLDNDARCKLEEAGIQIYRDFDFQTISLNDDGTFELRQGSDKTAHSNARTQLKDTNRFTDCICTVPWYRAPSFLGPKLVEKVGLKSEITTNPPSPISGIHLWFDREITELSHATFIGKRAHWLFNGTIFSGKTAAKALQPDEYYYQVVISSDMGSELARDELTQIILRELAETFPETMNATLLRHKFVEEKKAVFSYTSALDDFRPSQRTAVEHLYLAGDWTDTGWPSTMESAVRSGYFAADALLEDYGIEKMELPNELSTTWLASQFLR